MKTELAKAELDALNDLLIEQLGVTLEQLTPESRLEQDLGGDSMLITELGMAMEERFGIACAEAELDRIKTVADARQLLAECLQHKAAQG